MKLLLRGGSVCSLCWEKERKVKVIFWLIKKNFFFCVPKRFFFLSLSHPIFDEFSPFHPNEAISSFGSVFDDSGHGFRAMKKKTTEMRASPDDLNW